MKRKLTCFNFVVGKGITLVWLEKPCFENYVEMVAGLPRNEQKMKIFCKSNKRSYGVYKHIKNGQDAMLNFRTDLKSNPVVSLQTNPLVISTCRKSDSLCVGLTTPFLDS